jgi:hypothetical protein
MASKQIISLTKQNEGIVNSFKAKNIVYNELILNSDDSEEIQLQKLQEYNLYLKNLIKQNKPIVEKSKPVLLEQIKIVPKPKGDKPKEESDDDEEIVDEIEIVPKYPTICNMEDMKRAFFSGEYELFRIMFCDQQKTDNKLKLYRVNYKFASDFDRKPDFMARNLLSGFVQSLDDFRKYFMICFRCIKTEFNTYIYQSHWIVNTDANIKTVLGSIYDDNEFIVHDDINLFLSDFEKKTSDKIIGEVYLH